METVKIPCHLQQFYRLRILLAATEHPHLWGKGKVMNGKQNSRMSYWPISTGVPPHFFFQQKCLQLPDTFPRPNMSYVEYVRKSVISISEMNGYDIFNKFLTYFWYKWMSIRKFISKIGIGWWFTQSTYLNLFPILTTYMLSLKKHFCIHVPLFNA